MMDKKNILVVDDTKRNLDILIELLKDDYHVIPTLNGKNALNVLEKKDINLI